jgi:hypothetical protein
MSKYDSKRRSCIIDADSFLMPLKDMANTLVLMLLLYMVLPIVASALLLRFGFKVKGQMFNLLVGTVSLVGIYFMMTDGTQRFLVIQ